MPAVGTAELSRSQYVGEVLAGLHGHAGIRNVAERPERFGLAERLGQGPGAPWAFTLVRSKYKPASKLTAYYTVRSVADPRNERAVAVAWTPEGPGARARVLVSPEDPAMPQLKRLTRPDHVAARVRELTGARQTDGRPGEVRTIRYRPGQRHVLVVRPGRDTRPVYVKIDREQSGARAVPVAEHLRATLSAEGLGSSIVQPVGYCVDDAAALWWQAPGHPMARLLSAGGSDGSRPVERTGQLLRAMHDVAAPPRVLGTRGVDPGHRVRAEGAGVLRAGQHITALLPDVGASYLRLVVAVVQGLAEMPPEEPRFSHGDFKGGNILVHQGEPRVLDFDRSCLADPAVDLGKFLADLAWWCPNHWDLLKYQQAFREGYGRCDPSRWVRAELWSVLFRLKHASRRCPVHDAAWPGRVRDQVAGARAVCTVLGRTR